MKLLITTIAAVLVVGCGESQSPDPTTAKAPDISIHDAAKIGNIEAVKQHLAAGADVNALKNKTYEETPLRWAAWGGHKEIVELLIAKGADVNAKEKYGGTPLDAAIQSRKFPKGHPEVAELLRKHGAKTAEELKAEGK